MSMRSTNRFFMGGVSIQEKIATKTIQKLQQEVGYVPKTVEYSVYELTNSGLSPFTWEIDDLRKLHDLIEELMEQLITEQKQEIF